MNVKINNGESKEKSKSPQLYPSQYVMIPLWIIEDLIFRHRSSVIKTLVLFIARYTIGMRSECCWFSLRELSRLTKHSKKWIVVAIKECRLLGYISENMISTPEINSLGDGTKAYRINFLSPPGWKPPYERNTFFKAYNLTRQIQDIQLSLLEKVQEVDPNIDYLIEKTKNYLSGNITRIDFDDVVHMFER